VKSSNFTWLAELRYILRYLKEGWVFGISCVQPGSSREVVVALCS
jgi:hypothetical protein